MIPIELRPLIRNRIYGCDDCLAGCPWNKFARTATEPDFLPRAELTAPRLSELARKEEGERHDRTKSSISATSASLGAELLHRRREQLAAALRQSFDRPLQSIAQSPAPERMRKGGGLS
jgi:epoxyqueuosine reductase QueG